VPLYGAYYTGYHLLVVARPFFSNVGHGLLHNRKNMEYKRITERAYNSALEVLPPAAMDSHANIRAFLIGEPTTHNKHGEPVYGSYFAIDGEYFVGPDMTKTELHETITTPDKHKGIRVAKYIDEQTEQYFDLCNQYDQGAVDAYLALGIESDNGLDNFEEAYAGQYDSDEEFAQDMAENIGEVPTETRWPHYCIDWERAARELMYDYSEEAGYYFRNL